jgi:hypothetical protein
MTDNRKKIQDSLEEICPIILGINLEEAAPHIYEVQGVEARIGCSAFYFCRELDYEMNHSSKDILLLQVEVFSTYEPSMFCLVYQIKLIPNL